MRLFKLESFPRTSSNSLADGKRFLMSSSFRLTIALLRSSLVLGMFEGAAQI
jgi:hypothetical protein